MSDSVFCLIVETETERGCWMIGAKRATVNALETWRDTAGAGERAAMTDQRSGEDRRTNPRGGRRAGDPIVDLATHPAKFVTVTQAVGYINREICAVSRQTFYKWIRAGELPTHGLTRELSIKTDDLRLFILRQLRRRTA